MSMFGPFRLLAERCKPHSFQLGTGFDIIILFVLHLDREDMWIQLRSCVAEVEVEMAGIVLSLSGNSLGT